MNNFSTFNTHSLKEPAFTIIEMLVVIAIIGILSALLMPVLSSSLKSARSISCANNLKQIGVWGIQYSDDWNGILPHNGGDWVGSFKGYPELSGSSWMSKNQHWQKTVSQGTILHCPQASSSFPPQTTPAWDYGAYSNTYGLNMFLGGAKVNTGNSPKRPRSSLLRSNKFWFGDSGCMLQSNGKFSYFYLIYLNAWSGFNGRYMSAPYYHTEKPFHPEQAANFLYGDCSVSALPYGNYVSLSVSDKTRFHGGWW